MPLLTSPIPNLIGGISQQPPSVRTSSEAQDILNAVPSAVEGLTKRPPSEFVYTVTNSGTNPQLFPVATPPFIHVIERDNDEKYILTIANDGTIYVNDTAGTKKTITYEVLSSVTSTVGTALASQRCALTIGDVTFIANKTTSVLANSTVKTASPENYNRAGLIWIRQGNYGRTHTVKISDSTGAILSYSHTSIGAVITAAGSGGTNGTWPVTFTYISDTKWEVYPQGEVTVSGGKVTDVTITVAGSGPADANKSTLTATNASNIPSAFRMEYAPITSGDVGTLHVAQSLMYGGKSGYVGPAGGIYSRLAGSVLKGNIISLAFSSGQTPYNFTVTAEDDFAGDGLTFIRDVTDRIEDLPPTAPQAYIVKVTGSGESSRDDYWVQFIANNGTFSEGIWYECTAPGQKYQLNPATMPCILIRQSDGSFVLKYANGLTPSSTAITPAGSDYSAYQWVYRAAGDNDTNDFPTFLGKGITNMIYHQGRLGVMAADNIIFSETSEFFNFFRTTVLDVLDTDPIDIASSTPRVGNITAALQFNRDVVLFTPTSQMILRGGDVLSPKSVALAPAAEFENLSDTVRPFASANSIFFTYANGGFAGVRELVPQVALDGAYYANDLTNNVPRLIPNSVTHLTATTHDNIAMVVSGGHLYGYRYFTSGSEKLQSAWFRFQISDPNKVTAKVLWCQFINSDLYVALLRGGTDANKNLVIEKIRMGAGINDIASTGSTPITYLDNRHLFAVAAGSYNSTTNLTTFTLPKPMSYDATLTKAVTPTGYVLKIMSGTSYNTGTFVAGTINVLGDQSATKVWVGSSYDMEYVFSTPYLKGQAGRGVAAITSGRYQLRYLNLQYSETGYFRVIVDVKNEDSYEYLYTGITLGTDTLDTVQLDTGTFRVPLFSKNDNITISLINDTHLPCKILSGELEAFYNDRSQRTPQ
jgi:hypothetical protein